MLAFIARLRCSMCVLRHVRARARVLPNRSASTISLPRHVEGVRAFAACIMCESTVLKCALAQSTQTTRRRISIVSILSSFALSNYCNEFHACIKGTPCCILQPFDRETPSLPLSVQTHTKWRPQRNTSEHNVCAT